MSAGMLAKVGQLAGAVLAVMIGICFGLGAYTFYYAEGYSYLSDDPTACINCHIMRDHYDGWVKSSHHANATCNDCHIPHDNVVNKWYTKGENGFWHSYYFTFDNFHEPIQIRERNFEVLEANCVRCHDDLTSTINDEFVAHAQHPGEGRGCIHCHRDVGHGPPR